MPDPANPNPKQARSVGALAFRAQPGTLDAEKRTVQLTWTTGAAVKRWDWDIGSYNEELSTDPAHVRMDRLNNGAPFLADHDGGSVARTLGVVESARLDGGKGTAVVRFARAGLDPEADMVFEKIRDGVVQNVSVGYRVHKMEKTVSEAGKIPTYRATDWEPYEISAVAMGADDGAGFRSLFRSEQEHPTMPDKTPEQVAAEKAADEARTADLENARKEGEKRALDRMTAIQGACRKARLSDDFARSLVESGKSLDEARAVVLDELDKRSSAADIDGHQPIEVGTEDHEKWIRGVSAALLSRAGMTHNLETVLSEHKSRPTRQQNPHFLSAFAGVPVDGVTRAIKFDPTDHGGEFRALTLMDLARESLDRRGVKTRGMDKNQILNRAFYARDNGGQQTSSDFSVALENVMYKTLLGAYENVQDTWRRFCGVKSVQDFRLSNDYRLGSFGVLDAIDESGEYKHKVIPDVIKQTISTQTYGNKIALSRKAIINDDMGAVVASADRFGRMVGLSIEKAVYAQLALNSGLGPSVTYNGITAPLFDAQFANIGTSGALSVVTLDADRVTMGKQLDPSNNEVLGVVPSVLLVPLELGGLAKEINRAAYDPTAGAAFQAPNRVAGLFRDIVDTARASLISTTRRYLFSDTTPAMVVVFLNDVQVPFMEQRPGWDIDGLEWKIRLDFNAQGFDPKGALTNAGT